MTGFKHRLAGLALIAAAFVTTHVHHGIYDAARRGPPTLAEYAITLATMLLASTGILLVIHGAKLFARRATPGKPTVLVVPTPRREVRLDDCCLDSRDGVALLLARRAILAAAVRRASEEKNRTRVEPA